MLHKALPNYETCPHGKLLLTHMWLVEVQQGLAEVQQWLVEVQQGLAEVQQWLAEVQQWLAEVQQWLAGSVYQWCFGCRG